MGTPPDLDRLQALAELATPGPWRWPHSNTLAGAFDIHDMDGGGWSVVLGTHKNAPPSGDDAAYLAAVDPQTVLTLIAEIREHRDANGRCTACEIEFEGGS